MLVLRYRGDSHFLYLSSGWNRKAVLRKVTAEEAIGNKQMMNREKVLVYCRQRSRVDDEQRGGISVLQAEVKSR